MKIAARLRIVHRLDKETSGLVVFANSAIAERELERQFHAHTVVRKYLALVPGFLPAGIRSRWSATVVTARAPPEALERKRRMLK